MQKFVGMYVCLLLYHAKTTQRIKVQFGAEIHIGYLLLCYRRNISNLHAGEATDRSFVSFIMER